MRISSLPTCASIVVVAALLAAGAPARGGMLYLALGDSNAFGNDESTPGSTQPNNGDQGYVRPFADFLGALNGGVRPQVVNLAISGELSTSFVSGVAPTGWGARAPQLNTNYAGTTASQNALMLGVLDAAHLAGTSVTVTFNVGSNDFQYLLTTAAFRNATAAMQQAMLVNLLNQETAFYQGVVGEIQAHAPGTRILLPSFFNSLQTTDPNYAFSQQVTVAANQAIQQLAPSYGATYVDFFSIINGHQAQYANATGNAHLNQAGYAAVAQALDAAVVPEPASVVLLGLGLGLGGIVGRRYRRRPGSSGI